VYKYVLNSVVKISVIFAKYFEYYTIILRGAVFLWTRRIYKGIGNSAISSTVANRIVGRLYSWTR